MLERLQRAREAAEARVAELEMALRQQERLVVTLRWVVDAGSQSEFAPHQATMAGRQPGLQLWG